jgi:DNA primase
MKKTMIDTTHVDLLALIERDTPLKKVSRGQGGQWSGPCPFCGGKDRFQVWPNSDRPHYWCRKCGKQGDAIQYLVDRDGLSFPEACKALKVDLEPLNGQRRPPPRPPRSDPGLLYPAEAEFCTPGWQAAAKAFTEHGVDVLGTKAGQPAREYLHRRGLSDAVINAHALGYNADHYRALWGKVKVYLPPGIVIPWFEYEERSDGQPWQPGRLCRITVRSIDPHCPRDKRFITAGGGTSKGLYGIADFRPDKSVVMVEGELCALSLWQAVPGLVIPLATGSTTGARLFKWIARLALANEVILAFDADDDGEKASAWWNQILTNAVRLRPTRHDVNDMLMAGDDIAAWLQPALDGAPAQQG